MIFLFYCIWNTRILVDVVNSCWFLLKILIFIYCATEIIYLWLWVLGWQTFVIVLIWYIFILHIRLGFKICLFNLDDSHSSLVFLIIKFWSHMWKHNVVFVGFVPTFEPSHDKTSIMGLWPAWIWIHAVSYQFLYLLIEFVSEQNGSWSDCMDAQAGLDPCWSQTHYVGFVMVRLISEVKKASNIYNPLCNILPIYADTETENS
jgi:hypothetical protein